MVYPELEPIDDYLIKSKQDKAFKDSLNIEIMRLKAKGRSWEKIAEDLGKSLGCVYGRAKKLGINKKIR
ncbi:MAG: hypothetical protein ACXADY_01970 [Candidatus Hodarchaeales archaeon]|jgi:hypothetical protein